MKKEESTKLVKDYEEGISKALLSTANACLVRTRIYRPGHFTVPERPSKNGLMVILAEEEIWRALLPPSLGETQERLDTLASHPG